MLFTAHTLAQTMRLAADEAATLRTFIDDLDGWDGKDLDTGTNALRTFTALAHALDSAPQELTFATGLDLAVEAGIQYSVGHCGQLITLLLHTWCQTLNGNEQLTSVTLRRMLCADPSVTSSQMFLSDAVTELLAECREELNALGDTLPAPEDVINIYAAHSQFALIEATNHTTGRIDPGAAVLTLFFTCLDAIVRQDVALLSSFAYMLADLAASPEHSKGPQAHAPEAGRAFTVDMIVSASVNEIKEYTQRLDLLGTTYSCIGREDIFGLGEWRIHAATSAPMAVHPRDLTVRAFAVADARPHEMLGVDTLTDGVTHRGVRILERRPARRVERAHVLVLTHAPGLLDYYAQAGAIAILNPSERDLDQLMAIAAGATTGVTLVIPTSEATRTLADRMGEEAPHGDYICVAHCHDELSALSIAQATGTLFVPQPGGYQVAPVMRDLIEQTVMHAGNSFRTVAMNGRDTRALFEAVEYIAASAPSAWRLLTGRDEAFAIASMTQQLIASAASGIVSLETVDGAYDGPTLLQGIQ